MSEELSDTTKGKDIFNVLEKFFTQNNLGWGKLVGCTANGASFILGRKSEFQAHVKALSPVVTLIHCFIHRLALSAKVLPSELLSCLNRIIKIVNFIESPTLNTRVFARFCADLGCDHKCLIYPTQICWLARENIIR